MKSFSKLFASTVARICGALITLLGFSGCNNDGPNIGPEMYGTPYATFEVKGMVTDEKDQPVADATIRVADELSHKQHPAEVENVSGSDEIAEEYYYFAKTVTNQEGIYSISQRLEYAPESLRIECLPADPNLEPQTVIVDMEYNKTNGDEWHEGHAVLTVDFKLKAKSSDSE